MPRSRTTSKAWHVRDFSAHSATVEKSAATRWTEQSEQPFPIRRDSGFSMKVGIKRALGTILVGILGGAFGGFVVMLAVPYFDLDIWLGALTVGAMFGACMAVWVILRHRGIAGINDEPIKTR